MSDDRTVVFDVVFEWNGDASMWKEGASSGLMVVTLLGCFEGVRDGTFVMVNCEVLLGWLTGTTIRDGALLGTTDGAFGFFFSALAGRGSVDNPTETAMHYIHIHHWFRLSADTTNGESGNILGEKTDRVGTWDEVVRSCKLAIRFPRIERL